jgi:hypothetical protein
MPTASALRLTAQPDDRGWDGELDESSTNEQTNRRFMVILRVDVEAVRCANTKSATVHHTMNPRRGGKSGA